METGRREKVDSRLSTVLSHFYLVTSGENDPPKVFHLSPNLEMMLVFNFGPPVPFSFGSERTGERVVRRTGIFGPLRTMLHYELPGGSDLLVLNFTLNGFYRFFAVPMDAFPGNTAPEGAVAEHGNKLEIIWTTLAALPKERRTEWMTAYMLANLAETDTDALPLLDAAGAFHNPEASPVKVIARDNGLTERTVQGRFRKYTGYSSKELIRFLRFKEVLRYFLTIESGVSVDWAALVERHGYHDQSHLIKDFKYYTGVPPRVFLRMNEQDGFCMTADQSRINQNI